MPIDNVDDHGAQQATTNEGAFLEDAVPAPPAPPEDAVPAPPAPPEELSVPARPALFPRTTDERAAAAESTEARRIARKAELQSELAALAGEERAESSAIDVGAVVVVREGRRVDTTAGMPAQPGDPGLVTLVQRDERGAATIVAVDFAAFGVQGLSWGDCPADAVRPLPRAERLEWLEKHPRAAQQRAALRG